MNSLLIRLVKVYQRLSRSMAGQIPFLAFSGCRSWPTCSDYAINALQQHGAIQGSGKALWRLVRCNPLVRAHA